MSSQPKVSIIMNCHNGEKYLKSSIESIINQTYKNWELVFFDNSSTDNSKKIYLAFKDKRFKYYKSQKKINLYKARNLAIKKASGKYIAFLDTDDLWLKNKLDIQIKLIKKKKIKFIFSNYYILKNKLKVLYTKKKLSSGQITQDLLNFYYIPILTVLFEKKLIKNKKNVFDNNYNIIGDFDFFLNLSRTISFNYIHKPLAIYRIHENNYSKIYNKNYANEMKYWLKKNIIYYKNYDLKNFITEILYIKIKSSIYNDKFMFAFKNFLKYPNNIKKLKLFILFFLPKKFFTF